MKFKVRYLIQFFNRFKEWEWEWREREIDVSDARKAIENLIGREKKIMSVEIKKA